MKFIKIINLNLFSDSICKECNECFPGSYSNKTGQAFCQLCDIGTFQEYFGKKLCEDCPAGFDSKYIQLLLIHLIYLKK